MKKKIMVLLFGLIIVSLVGGVLGEDELNDEFIQEQVDKINKGDNPYPEWYMIQARVDSDAEKVKAKEAWNKIDNEKKIIIWKSLVMVDSYRLNPEADPEAAEKFKGFIEKERTNEFLQILDSEQRTELLELLIKDETKRDVDLKGLENAGDNVRYVDGNIHLKIKDGSGEEYVIPLKPPEGFNVINFRKQDESGDEYGVFYSGGEESNRNVVLCEEGKWLEEVEGKNSQIAIRDSDDNTKDPVIDYSGSTGGWAVHAGKPSLYYDKNGNLKTRDFPEGPWVWGDGIKITYEESDGNIVHSASPDDIRSRKKGGVEDPRPVGFANREKDNIYGVRGIITRENNPDTETTVLGSNSVKVVFDKEYYPGVDEEVVKVYKESGKNIREHIVPAGKRSAAHFIVSNGAELKAQEGFTVLGANIPGERTLYKLSPETRVPRPDEVTHTPPRDTQNIGSKGGTHVSEDIQGIMPPIEEAPPPISSVGGAEGVTGGQSVGVPPPTILNGGVGRSSVGSGTATAKLEIAGRERSGDYGTKEIVLNPLTREKAKVRTFTETGTGNSWSQLIVNNEHYKANVWGKYSTKHIPKWAEAGVFTEIGTRKEWMWLEGSCGDKCWVPVEDFLRGLRQGK